MQIIIQEIAGKKIPWRWSLRSKDRIVTGGRAKTRERAEQAAKKASRLTECCRCGEWAAGGGHRFCRPCLLWQLDQPINRTPFEPGSRQVDVTHAPIHYPNAHPPYSSYYTSPMKVGPNAHPPSPFIGHTNGKV